MGGKIADEIGGLATEYSIVLLRVWTTTENIPSARLLHSLV
jgi:hypothetical protein